MWLAADETLSSGGITGIVVAVIGAVSTIVVTLVRRRPAEPAPDEVREKAATAADAGVNAATSALAGVLVEKQAEIRKLEKLLDEAYQGGFVPRRPRPRGDSRD